MKSKWFQIRHTMNDESLHKEEKRSRLKKIFDTIQEKDLKDILKTELMDVLTFLGHPEVKDSNQSTKKSHLPSLEHRTCVNSMERCQSDNFGDSSNEKQKIVFKEERKENSVKAAYYLPNHTMKNKHSSYRNLNMIRKVPSRSIVNLRTQFMPESQVLVC